MQTSIGFAEAPVGATDAVPTTTGVQMEPPGELPHAFVAVTQTCAVPLYAEAQFTVPVVPDPETVFPDPLTVQL
jgi:hypothetical protein